MFQFKSVDVPPWDSIIKFLPTRIGNAVEGINNQVKKQLEEVRIRAERPLMVHWHGLDSCIDPEGGMCVGSNALIPDEGECRNFMENICRHSVYAVEEQLKYGYITLEGGFRIGLGGKAVMEGGEVRTIRECMSFNIRIAREIKGCANKLIGNIKRNDGSIFSTILISPPQKGKTTLIRDAARQISNGIGIKPHKVCVIDERSEIGSCTNGIPQMDLGIRTDILDSFPKDRGIMQALRSLSPEVIITDEIGGRADADAVEEAANCGVCIIATMHGCTPEDIRNRPALRALLDTSVFDRFVLLGDSLGKGTIEGVYDRYLVKLEGLRGEAT